MKNHPSSPDLRIERSLTHSVRDGAAFSVMAGMGETYFPAFALFFKASTEQIGFLASFPPLLGSFAQIFSAWLGHKTNRRKAIILLGVMLQGLVWLPLCLLPFFFPVYSIQLLTLCIVFYYAFGNLASPQWASLMGDLVEETQRGRFFANRIRVSSITTFISIVIAGLVLHYFERADWTATGFILIFSVAFVARIVSVYHLFMMYNPPGHVAAMELPSGIQWLTVIRSSHFVRFSLFFVLMQFGVYMSSPFFSVYILRDLHFTYLQFMSCTAATVMAQFFTMNAWGAISDRFGNRVVLLYCGISIPFLPLLWVFSENFYYLVLTQAIAGLVWAGFNLSAGNFLYDIIPPSRRATYIAIHTVLANMGLFFGAMVGGTLATLLPSHFFLMGLDIHWASSLCNIFLISFIFRMLAAAIFLPGIKEIRPVQPFSLSEAVFRVGRFTALSGLIFDIVGSKRKKPPQS